MKLPSGEYHKTSLMISQHSFKQWLGAVSQQDITLVKIDSVLYGVIRPQ